MNKENLHQELLDFAVQFEKRNSTETDWRPALIGCASANDSLFGDLNQAGTPDHLLPRDLLPTAKSAVAFFFPFGKRIENSNRSGRLASQEWARAYIETNALIEQAGNHLVRHIKAHGYEACLTPATHNFDSTNLVSNWSHHHIAFIAGLGTFGMNNMLITESGCCGRFGSFVTSFELETDIRPDTDFCLYKSNGICGVCVDKCVGEALFTDRFDRHACYTMCLENGGEHRLVGKADVCGKCLVGLPCSFTNPGRKK